MYSIKERDDVNPSFGGSIKNVKATEEIKDYYAKFRLRPTSATIESIYISNKISNGGAVEVAITGLETAIDIPGIVGVFYMRELYGLVDFAQYTGRGRRV